MSVLEDIAKLGIFRPINKNWLTLRPANLLESLKLFCDNFELESALDALVAFYLCIECAEFLDLLGGNGDILLVNLDTCIDESLCKLCGGDRTINLAALAHLCGYFYEN